MKNKTTEFSFILKPSEHGIGVFTTHAIAGGSYLRLFGDENKESRASIIRDKRDVPKNIEIYCIDRGERLICPRDFGRMEVGWYLNHSKSPNAFHRNYDYYASRDIKSGEEIVIDYNSLEESEEAKDDYYKQ